MVNLSVKGLYRFFFAQELGLKLLDPSSFKYSTIVALLQSAIAFAR